MLDPHVRDPQILHPHDPHEFIPDPAFEIAAPDGKMLSLARHAKQETHTSFRLEQIKEITEYYQEEGYVVIRNLIPLSLAEAAYGAFRKEVKTYPEALYRQASANPEKHEFTDAGWMLNSLLNLQDLRRDLFPTFQATALSLLTHDRIQKVLEAIFQEKPTLVQSMFFEGNPATWAHQDSYYLDTEPMGKLLGIWIAAEPIAPGAGRFYVYPKSHKLNIPVQDSATEITNHHGAYKKRIINTIKESGLVCTAPALNTGDAVIWNSLTIHGSLSTKEPHRSRASFTGHYIPESAKFLQHQSRIKSLRTQVFNGMKVNFPKDQNIKKNQMILNIESRYPKTVQKMKRMVIRLMNGLAARSRI